MPELSSRDDKVVHSIRIDRNYPWLVDCCDPDEKDKSIESGLYYLQFIYAGNTHIGTTLYYLLWDTDIVKVHKLLLWNRLQHRGHQKSVFCDIGTEFKYGSL